MKIPAGKAKVIYTHSRHILRNWLFNFEISLTDSSFLKTAVPRTTFFLVWVVFHFFELRLFEKIIVKSCSKISGKVFELGA